MAAPGDSAEPSLKRGRAYKLELGQSFRNRQAPLHNIQYDFKPAKLNEQLPGSLLYTRDNSEVRVALHSANGGEEQFAGQCQSNKRECVLIYDEETDTFTIEKLTSTSRLKKDRAPNSRLQARPTLPSSQSPTAAPRQPSPPPREGDVGSSSDSDSGSSSSSSSSSDSSSSDDDDQPTKRPHTEIPTPAQQAVTHEEAPSGDKGDMDDLGLSDDDDMEDVG